MQNNIHILIADDDPDIVRAISEYCSLLGYTNIYNARDGEEALHTLLNNDIQVALIDINMPKLNGIALIAEMSAIHYRGKLCIISEHDSNVLTSTQRIAQANGLQSVQCIAKKHLSLSALQNYLDEKPAKTKRSFWQRLSK